MKITKLLNKEKAIYLLTKKSFNYSKVLGDDIAIKPNNISKVVKNVREHHRIVKNNLVTKYVQFLFLYKDILVTYVIFCYIWSRIFYNVMSQRHLIHFISMKYLNPLHR